SARGWAHEPSWGFLLGRNIRLSGLSALDPAPPQRLPASCLASSIAVLRSQKSAAGIRNAGISKKGPRGYRLAIARRRRSALALDRRHVLALRFPLPGEARASAPRSRPAGSPPQVVPCLPEIGEAR